MTSMTSSASEYFDAIAPTWDAVQAGFFNETVREAVIQKAYLRREMVVADVGAGTGFMAQGLAPLVEKVFVLDGSKAMLEQAQSNLAGYDNLVFQEADGLDLPLEDGSLDAVFANMYLHHCTDPLAAILEIVRVLKPGGRLIITDLDSHPHEWLKTEMSDKLLGFDRSQIYSWLRQADLVNILVGDTKETCRTGSTIENTSFQESEAQISIFIAAGTRRVSGARQAVKSGYTAAALGNTSCCTPGERNSTDSQPDSLNQSAANSTCCTSSSDRLIQIDNIDPVSFGYSIQDLEDIPPEAAQISLGCGNPTAFAKLHTGETVLDIGSGGGIDAFLAARQVGESGRVIGVDMTEAMVDRAGAAARKASLTQVEFRLGQAENLPVENSSVDVILSNCVINLCEDKEQVFNEAYRVLRAGGRLEISDIVSDKPLPIALRSDPETWAGCVWGALPETEYTDLIKQAGFEELILRRSMGMDDSVGFNFYSLIVSAKKPA